MNLVVEKLSLALCLVVIQILCVSCSTDRAYIGETQAYELTEDWKEISTASAFDQVKITFALKQRNTKLLEEIFWSVSNPKSPQYGKYLTKDQITEIVSPTEDTIRTVTDWLEAYGVKDWKLVANRDMIEAKVPIYKAESLLNTQYNVYKHKPTGKHYVRSLGPYSAPLKVAQQLDFIIGGIGIPEIDPDQPPRFLSRQKAMEAGGMTITPMILRERYNISKLDIGGNKHNRQAVVEFLNDWYSSQDLEQFFNQFWPEEKYNHSIARLIGDEIKGGPTAHANQDVEYIMGMAPNVPTWYYSNTGTDFWSDLTEWTNSLNSESGDIPLVYALTYGNMGEGPNQDYRERMNIEFQKLGVRGCSILVASGDTGTGCYLCWYYYPTFPATSPYVTAVGATKFVKNSVGPEAAVHSFGSGGGFSWHFEQPPYQTQFVTHYFASAGYIPEAHFFNRNGRGVPDIAALGVGYEVIVGGNVQILQGTASATITVAAIISLLNEERLDHEKPPLGFLNPLLYETSLAFNDAFFDVTQGNNHWGCCGWTGFNCAKGWDPVTGLGTPNYRKLYEVVRKLP